MKNLKKSIIAFIALLSLILGMLLPNKNVFADETVNSSQIQVIPEYDLTGEPNSIEDYKKKEKDYTNYRIAVLGDSIAAGIGTTDPSKTFGELSAAYMRTLLNSDTSVSVTNWAVDGMNSEGLAYNLLYGKYYKHSVKDIYEWDAIQDIISADQIQISIGGNDSLLEIVQLLLDECEIDLSAATSTDDVNSSSQAFFEQVKLEDLLKVDFGKLLEIEADGTSHLDKVMQKFDKNMSITFSRIRELNPTASIMILSTFNPMKALECLTSKISLLQNVDELMQILDIANAHVNAKILELCNEDQNSYYVDITKEFDTLGLFLTGMLSGSMDPHPSDTGHQVIFSKIKPVLNGLDVTEFTNRKEVNRVIAILRYLRNLFKK